MKMRIVEAVHLADIKFGDLTANTDRQTFSLSDCVKILSQCLLKNSIGDNFSLAIKEKFAQLLN